MKDATLNDLIDVLKPKQQEYICWCVREYGVHPNMHRGLLPFLSASEAVACLKIRVETIKGDLPNLKVGEEASYRTNFRFLHEIISICERVLPPVSSENDGTVTIYLKTGKLVKWFGRRLNFKVVTVLCFRDPIKLEPLAKDNWKITTTKRQLEQVTIWLAENFR